MMKRSSKHSDVRRVVEEAIRSGQFGPGDQLPSEVELAQRCSVSYMTARKAVAELVAADVLERRASKGTFVRLNVGSRLASTTLNLIVSAYEGSHTKEFILRGVNLAKRKGWSSNIIRLTPDQQDPAVRVIRNGELAVLMLDDIPRRSSLWHAMKDARGRAVSFHVDLSDDGIPTVYSDATRDLTLAVERLREAGHVRIALVIQAPEGDAPVSWRLTAQNAVDRQSIRVDILDVVAPLFESPMRPCYEAVRRHLAEHPETTAFVTKSDELAAPTIAACRDAGRPVPESVSLVNLGNFPSMEFTNPPATCIDFNYGGQFAEAEIAFEAALGGSQLDSNVRVVDGFLVERGSVAPVRS